MPVISSYVGLAYGGWASGRRGVAIVAYGGVGTGLQGGVGFICIGEEGVESIEVYRRWGARGCGCILVHISFQSSPCPRLCVTFINYLITTFTFPPPAPKFEKIEIERF